MTLSEEHEGVSIYSLMHIYKSVNLRKKAIGQSLNLRSK